MKLIYGLVLFALGAVTALFNGSASPLAIVAVIFSLTGWLF